MKNTSEKGFAMVERYALTPGIFTLQQKNCDKERLELIYKAENFKVEIVGPYKLNEIDALVLLNLLCLAAHDKKIIKAERQSEKGKKLRTDLELIAEAADDPALAVEITLYKLAQMLGMDWCGKTANILQLSLKRMCATTFFLERKERTDGFRLLSRLVIKKNEIAVCINPLLASAIINKSHFALVDLSILNNLKKPQERLLYIMLSNAIDRGKKKSYTQEEIRMIMYGEAKNAVVARKQKQRATEAMQNLQLPGFTAVIDEEKMITISRER